MTRYIIRLNEGVDIEAFAAEISGVVRVLARLRMIVVDMDAATAEALATDPRVEFVEEDQTGEGADAGGSQSITNEWHLDRIDQRELPLDGTYEWDRDGTGVRIYILDTGIRGTHEAFTGRLGPGWSAFAAPNDDPYADPDGHGTRVAGAAAGLTTGPARGATVCSVRFAEHSGAFGSSSSDLVAGVDWILGEEEVRGGPAVVNFSYSHENSTAAAAFQSLIDAGIPVFTSAMNSGTEIIPAAGSVAEIREVMYVSSTESDDTFGPHNYGARVDLLAPGVGVWTAMETGDSDYDARNGTSYASPIAAGVAALLLQEQPDLSLVKLYAILKGQATTGQITGVPSGTTDRLIYSRVEDVSDPDRVQVHVGTVEVPATVGLQEITWGLDADWPIDAVPKAVIFYMLGINSDPVTDATVYPDISAGIGFATHDGVVSHAVGAHTSSSISGIGKRVSGRAIHVINTQTTNDRNSAAISSWGINGFTLDWDQVSMAYPQKVAYIALGGAIEAKAVAWQYPSTAGPISVTDVGFQPDIVLHTFSRYDLQIGSFKQPGTASANMGVMTANGEQWAMSTQIPNGSSPNLARSMSDELAIAYPTSSLNGAENNAGAFASMDPDGFTLNLTNPIADTWGISLCIKGGVWQVGTLEQPTSAGIGSLAVPGMDPLGILVSSVVLPATDMNTGSKANAFWQMGAAGRNTAHTIAIGGTRSSNTYHQRQDAALGTVYQTRDFDPALSTVTVDDLTRESIDLNWSDADSTGAVFGYIAFGNEPLDPPPVPQNLVAVAVNHESIQLTWEPGVPA